MKRFIFLFLFLIVIMRIDSQNIFQGFVNVKDVDSSIVVDLMYAKSDNFVGEKMYDFEDAYLHLKAAKAIKKANTQLKRINPNLRLIIYDAARPMSVQRKMWNKVKGTRQQNYVSNPANGGGLHNYGLAVDVSIINIAKGDTLPMGTKVDALISLSHIDEEEELVNKGFITSIAVKNRSLLRMVMKNAGFYPLKSEWWHFNYTTRTDARANYKVIQ